MQADRDLYCSYVPRKPIPWCSSLVFNAHKNAHPHFVILQFSLIDLCTFCPLQIRKKSTDNMNFNEVARQVCFNSVLRVYSFHFMVDLLLFYGISALILR